ncbi:Mus81p [Rhodotorula paludigena]|uniref:Mus81p n=1 Tax=Rhodotorula paludigena TaxID=86838 RepID=UPI0031821BEE
MPKVQPGNPDWAQWVAELASRSEERGEKSAQTYKRAAHSLKSCPITFTHPDETRQLKGIGPKIIDYIMDKLRAKCEQEGVPMPDRVGSPTRARKAPGKKRVVAPEDDFDPREARRQRLTDADAVASGSRLAFNPHPDGHIFGQAASDDEGPEEDFHFGAKGKGKGKAKEKAPPKPREYIPKKNSGAYAILLALYKHASFDERQAWRTKAQIIEDGEEYSTTPFETGTANRGGQIQGGQSFTYSAWSGMKTLQNKDLVESDNKRPAKFALTASGYALAEKLAPSASLPLHVRQPSSSAGHPSSSGLGGGGGEAHPSSSGSFGGPQHQHRPFAGRGNILGGASSGPRPASTSGAVHASAPRRRVSTPPLDFGLGDEMEDDEPEFREQMRRAMELSQRESSALLTSEAGEASSRARAQRPPTGGSGSGGGGGGGGAALDGRKAALGGYAARAAEKGAAPAMKNVDNAFGYFYLDEDNNRVLNRDEAEVSQTDDGADLLFRIEYRVAQDLHPIVRGLKKVEPLTRAAALPGGTTKSAYIRARVSNDTAPGFPRSSAGLATPADKQTRPSDPMSSLLGGYQAPEKRVKDAMYAPPPEVRRFGADASALTAQRGASSVRDVLSRFGGAGSSSPAQAIAGPSTGGAVPRKTSNSTVHPSSNAPALSPSPTRTRTSASTILADAPRTFVPTSSQNPLLVAYDPPANMPHVARHPLDPVRDSTATSPFSSTPFTPIVWPAGSFKVFLVVDSREGTREHGKRVELCEKLEREGVRVAGKMMPLGDMLWVARRVDPVSGRATGGDDVVLDAIVERKRLDDLCTSILDGRYIGQKLRLKDSGITHRIYLIEKYDVAAQYEKFGKQIWTCKSQLQVNDGFYVHESANIADTLNYLKKRTQIMAELYESTNLHIIPDTHIDRTTYLSLQQHLRRTAPATSYHTSYASFCALNKPDAALTLRAQWASMIQRVSGVSAEKAVQFLSRWETPVQFFDEAKAHEREVDDENRALDAAAGVEGKAQPKKRGAPKRRKAEDFVLEQLDDGSGTARGIKGKLGAKIWEVFMTSGKYAT